MMVAKVPGRMCLEWVYVVQECLLGVLEDATGCLGNLKANNIVFDTEIRMFGKIKTFTKSNNMSRIVDNQIWQH